jgi:CHASE3 domain sensor protein
MKLLKLSINVKEQAKLAQQIQFILIWGNNSIFCLKTLLLVR